MHLLQQITFQISIEHSRIHRDIAKNVVGNSNVVVSKNLNSLTENRWNVPPFWISLQILWGLIPTPGAQIQNK